MNPKSFHRKHFVDSCPSHLCPTPIPGSRTVRTIRRPPRQPYHSKFQPITPPRLTAPVTSSDLNHTGNRSAGASPFGHSKADRRSSSSEPPIVAQASSRSEGCATYRSSRPSSAEVRRMTVKCILQK
ncbi:hypothetical protein AB6A40_004405 [Gnathostoma spinigerum]|uniref:Uncharacterized protein n=1 Tax=Gnathostoma spinigerum TaxID=75299 RepID=A0ABD6EJU8_9BILA